MKAATVVKKVRSGSMFIDVREYADGRFGFDFLPPAGERIRVRRRELDDAARQAKEMLGTTQAGKIDLLSIDPGEFAEFLRWREKRRASVPVPVLVASFLATKRSKGRSVWTVKSLEGALDSLATAFPGPIGSLSGDDVEDWLNSREVGPRRWNNLLAMIVALVRYARRQGYIGADLSTIEQIERRHVQTTIGTYSPSELSKIIAATPHDWRPAVVLGAFAGIRPEEICPGPGTPKPGLAWENILWDRAKIDVPASVSKIGRRRFVPLLESTAAFLNDWRRARGPVVERKVLSNVIRTISSKSGVKWLNDGLRHSYASYRLAITKNIPELALEMGNSASIIFGHYLDLKHEEEAKQWFALRP